MEAPDKIYISHHYKQPIDYGFFKTENAEPYTVEYIHKDALLEWLEGKMTVEGATEGIVGGYDFALKDVINKLNSM